MNTVRTDGTVGEPEPRDLVGALDADVVATELFKSYTSTGWCGGYIGSYDRTPERDRIVCKILRECGLGPRGIATWLSSGDGRHMMDDVRGKRAAAFRMHVREWTQDAFLDVTVWSHPDHNGSLNSSTIIKSKLLNLFQPRA